MIVVGELDAGLLAGFAGFVEEITARFHPPGSTRCFSSIQGRRCSCGRRFSRPPELPATFFRRRHSRHGRRGMQGVLVEDGADILRRMIEVAGEFHFLVAGAATFARVAFEVGFHGVATV